MTRRIDHICEECGGSIYWDASAYWDTETQEFRMSDGGPNDGSFCSDCGGECTSKTIDLDTGEDLDTAPNGVKWIPKAEAEQLWKEYHAKREAEWAKEKQGRAAIDIATYNAQALAAEYDL